MLIKKIMLGSVIAVASTSAFAASASDDLQASNNAQHSMYAGVEGGYAHQSIKSASSVTRTEDLNQIRVVHKNTADYDSKAGIDGRVFAGYNVNDWFGVEMGLAGAKNTINATGHDGVTSVYALDKGKQGKQIGKSTKGEERKGSFTNKIYTVDLAARFKQDISDTGLFAFEKVGAAYVVSKGDDETAKNFAPEAGVGLGYNVTDNVAVTGSVNHIFGRGNRIKDNDFNKKFVPSLTTANVGVVYSFA